jgi:hypothetical protein
MAKNETMYPAGTRAVEPSDVDPVGPWYSVERPFASTKPHDAGEVVAAGIFRDTRRMKEQRFIAHDAVSLPELMRNGASCAACSAAFISGPHALAHWRRRHSEDAIRKQSAEDSRQQARDEADRKGEEDSRRLYGLENMTCWACGSAVRPGTHIEPRPDGFRPKAVAHPVVVSAGGPDLPPAA